MIRFVLQIKLLQLFRLFAGSKGVDDLIEVAVQDLCKVVHRQADAVVGAAVLREIVGADLLAAVTGAHLPLPLGVDGVLLPGSPLLPALAERFGADILKADGTLDRRLLADRAFATPEGKAALDGLTHPEIVRRIRAAKQAAQEAGAPLFVLDGAVIVGTAAQAECDRLCVVTAPFETSVARIVARDGIAPEMACRRLNAQTPEAELTAQADYVLHNDADLAALQAAAEQLCSALQTEGGASHRF